MISKEEMIEGSCNECGYKADYIIDYNNYNAHSYDNFDEVPHDQLLCGACWDVEKFNILQEIEEYSDDL